MLTDVLLVSVVAALSLHLERCSLHTGGRTAFCLAVSGAALVQKVG